MAKDKAATRHPSVVAHGRSVAKMNRQLRDIQEKLQAVQQQLAQEVGIAPSQPERRMPKRAKKKAI